MRRAARYRPYAGIWIGVPLAVVSCLVAGIVVTAAAVALSVIVSGAASALGRIRGPRRRAGGRLPPEVTTVPIAGISWALAAAAQLIAPAGRVIRTARELHPLRAVRALVLIHSHVITPWTTLVDLLVAGALVSSLLAVRALRRPRWAGSDGSHVALERARGIVHDYGEDSLSPFILRPDKRFEFSADGVVAYRVIGETAVVSGDPVGPEESAHEALEELLRRAHQGGVQVVVYGGSERHLATYRSLGLRTVCVGEEAVVDPATFTLEGRAVRKLRQSVHRVQRRGWRIAVCEGRDIDGPTEAEIGALEAAWRFEKSRLHGFTMSMGEFEPGVRPDDLYALAWSPDGRLQAVMRFLAHRGKLSLDTMRRVGETPNGLNEALVGHALQAARSRGVPEVSLNYAGLGHLVRQGPSGNWFIRTLTRVALGRLRTRFQMDRLVLFNQKFSPSWRPRYLVFESRLGLPRAVFRVLQAEGYLAHKSGRRRTSSNRRALSGSAAVEDGIGR
jgi:lysyl-tRNA synthetase class 2